MSSFLQRPLDPRVPLLGLSVALRITRRRISRRSPGMPGVRPLPRDQLSVPSENRVGRDERRNLSQHAASESLPQHGEPSALIIAHLEPAP
jgi:hypothetical protein